MVGRFDRHAGAPRRRWRRRSRAGSPGRSRRGCSGARSNNTSPFETSRICFAETVSWLSQFSRLARTPGSPPRYHQHRLPRTHKVAPGAALEVVGLARFRGEEEDARRGGHALLAGHTQLLRPGIDVDGRERVLGEHGHPFSLQHQLALRARPGSYAPSSPEEIHSRFAFGKRGFIPLGLDAVPLRGHSAERLHRLLFLCEGHGCREKQSGKSGRYGCPHPTINLGRRHPVVQGVTRGATADAPTGRPLRTACGLSTTPATSTARKRMCGSPASRPCPMTTASRGTRSPPSRSRWTCPQHGRR